jgi:phage repressor protein C with HTH and peptisase S24 domain
MNRKNAFAIALAATLLTATGAQAQSYPPRDETQAPRGQDVQAPRQDNEDVQAPRGTNQDVQAPRGDNEDVQAPRGDNEDVQAPRG